MHADQIEVVTERISPADLHPNEILRTSLAGAIVKLENEMCKDPKITIRNTADHESGRRNATQKSSGLYFTSGRVVRGFECY